jgi:hypothetical protein
MKSGNLNFLEPSGPFQACNGTALPLPLLLLLLLLFYWLQVSASKGHHQANIYKKHKNVGAYSTKTLILWVPIYIYHQPLDVLSVVKLC